MKKLLAILLILAMLIPMGTVAHAEESADKPYYFLQWQGFESDFSNIYPMPYLWGDKARLDRPLESVSLAGQYDISLIAAYLKEMLDAYPEGARFATFALPLAAYRNMAEDAVIVEKPAAVVKEWIDAFIPEYHRIGGKLEGMNIDIEFEDLSAYNIEQKFAVNDPLIYDKIVKNPAYEEKIRPQLVEHGFKFFPNPNELTPEIYSIHSSAGIDYAESRTIWDTVLRNYVNKSITDACAVVWEYYPDCEINDYQSKDVVPWVHKLNDYGGAIISGGNSYTVGTSSNENCYFVKPYNFFTNPSTKAPAYNTIPGYNFAVYEESPFNYFKFYANNHKNTYLCSSNSEVSFWITHCLYNLGNPKNICLTPYYAETILHMGMLDPAAIMSYVVPTEIEGNEQVFNFLIKYDFDEIYEIVLSFINDIMAELTRVVGKADREPINVSADWNNDYVLSGMRVDDKNIWRLTPNTDFVSVEDFKVEGTDPTFYVNGQTITFPQGKIIADGNIHGIDIDNNILDNRTCGYWIETPAGVNPIESRVENYHVEYPAFEENYDSYEIGMEYNYKNALPKICWESKKSGTVVANPADSSDKVLALKNNVTLTNVNIPKNITAGDSYAENQAWQVSVTLPADMSEEAEVVLLAAGNEKRKSRDGGFVIAGNKLYYSQDGEYMEMAGVTLSAGVEYTLKRELNFNNPEQFTSNFYVYDNTGKLVGEAKNVVMDTVDLPVETITLSCSNVSGEPVLLDDYKLYPIKVGTDFKLYSAEHGLAVADYEVPVAGDTGYRFSWMNATNVEKSYSVVAQYYNGDTMASEEIIKEVKMAPNSEGAEFGVVELGDKGKAVKIFIKDNNPAEEDDTTGTGDNTGDDTGKTDGFVLDTKMIIIIAAAVVLIAVIVIVIVVSSKKKAAKKAAAATIEEAPAEEAPAVEEATETEEAPAEETPETDAE